MVSFKKQCIVIVAKLILLFVLFPRCSESGILRAKEKRQLKLNAGSYRNQN